MSTLFGIIKKSHNEIPITFINEVIEKLTYWKPDNHYTYITENVILTNHLLNTTPQSINEHISNYYNESGCIIISDSRLDYRNELIEQLAIDFENNTDVPDNYLILKAYLKWDESCVDHFFGDFAFAIWDGRNNKLFCARDHFGIRPLYYLNIQDYFFISSEFMIFQTIPGFKYELNENYLIDSLCSIMPDKQSSAFTGIFKLEPAHFLVFREKSIIKKCKYWDLKVNEKYIGLNEEQAIDGLRERFIASVKNRLNPEVQMGIELSGGIDSSSIASCLLMFSREFKYRLISLTHSLTTQQQERMPEFIDSFKLCQEVYEKNPNIELKEISGFNRPGCASAIIDYLKVNLKPLTEGFSIISDLLYEEAYNNGVKILFSGYGGDQGVTHPGTQYFYELINTKKWASAKDIINKKYRNNWIKRNRLKIRIYLQIHAPRISKIIRSLKFFNRNFYDDRFRQIPINNKLAREKRIKEKYKKRVIIPTDHTLQQRLYQRINSAHSSDRIENSYYAARKWRIEYRYPFFDVKLIEFYYSIESYLKFKDGIKRYLFRAAMNDILDDRIRLIPDKFNAAIPNFRYRIVQDIEWFSEIVKDAEDNCNYNYLDFGHLNMFLKQIKKSTNRRRNLELIHFIKAIVVLLLQKWQRENRINIGIKN